MEVDVIRTITDLKKVDKFDFLLKKLTISEIMSYEDKTYILGCALLLLQEYQHDKRGIAYFEFAYYIILKYSVTYNDFQPLYDIANNFGLYPIIKFISQSDETFSDSIQGALTEIKVNSFKNDNHIVTAEQFDVFNNILLNKTKELSFVAPTSYGKSALIFQHILKNQENKKIVVIVPTKSLLAQTFKQLKREGIKRKIIIHDEMYNGEEEFVAVLTQERALRLLEKHKIYYDILYIDEAHNIFNKDYRSILLSRLIKKNKIRNNKQKVIYLSPLIDNSDNLKLYSEQLIVEQRISFNIKEPEIFELKLDGKIYQYNRFVNEFYYLGSNKNYLSYIFEKATGKSFFYLYSPRKIENFSKVLFDTCNEEIENAELIKIKRILCKYVHKDFYVIKYIEKGIIYLHGKLPDIVKEYLESKFRDNDSLRYVVANSVILEGINLPVETLFVLNTDNLYGKELTNLIGRVNRLNEVFDMQDGCLTKLMPKIYFINNKEFSRKKSNMSNKIKLLRSRKLSDEIKNPILESFDYENAIKSVSNEGKIELDEKIANEKIAIKEPKDNFERVKQLIVNLGINEIINYTDETIQRIIKKANRLLVDEEYMSLSVLEKVYQMFVLNMEVKDKEFRRLEKEKARKYYSVFLKLMKERTLNEQIKQQYVFFRKRANEDDPYMYMGKSYGEVKRPTDDYNAQNVYVDLREKSDIELVNLVIVKIKMEQDFISYKYYKFVQFLLELDLITDDEYNDEIYGTRDIMKIELLKMGLTPGIINKLSNDNQICNLNLDENNNLQGNKELYDYIALQDDFIQFEIEKYL